ncbi:tetratricopeptide repeat protein [Synechococcus sp. AH-551-A10]|nr:tetratricopeptide repeat protein [Synechococcus sp. AH-551-A10]MDB4682138.1 tetratricopeptide repeat protein [Synechococcus sp. AH-551-A10]
MKNSINDSTLKSISEIQELFERKQYQSAINYCDSILNLESEKQNVDIICIKANSLIGLKKYNAAKDLYIKGLSDRPGDIKIAVSLARLNCDLKEYAKAIDIFQALAEDHPDDASHIENLNRIKSALQTNELIAEKKKKNSDFSRLTKPLSAAFNVTEIDECNKNLKERERINLEKKLKNPPIPPLFDPDTLAEEWYLAGKDALRDGQYQVALLMCIKAAESQGNLNHIYVLAAEAYLSNKNFNAAHLCYLIASQHGELDASSLSNLVSLAITTGDKKLAEIRYSQLNETLPNDSPMKEQADKMMSKINNNTSTYFHPQYGPVNKQNIKDNI